MFTLLFLFNLQGCYPAKLKKVLIVTAPLWFKAPFKILRLFVREKLRDRVFTISLPQVRKLRTSFKIVCIFIFYFIFQLVQHIPRESLPKHLGGTINVEHDKWLDYCKESIDKYGSSAMSDQICNSNNTKKDTAQDTKVHK